MDLATFRATSRPVKLPATSIRELTPAEVNAYVAQAVDYPAGTSVASAWYVRNCVVTDIPVTDGAMYLIVR